MPITVQATTSARAPKETVWEVLADFPNIADYTDTVKTSIGTSEQASGIGASRRCELAPLGSLEERIIDFAPGEHLGISIHKATRLPIKTSETTFSLTAIDAHTTQLTMNAKIQFKGVARFVSQRLQARLSKQAQKTVGDLAAAAERLAQAPAT